MNHIFDILAYLLLGRIIWRRILKKDAYPISVKPYLKWVHAIIMYYVLINAWLTLKQIIWLLYYPSELVASLTSRPNEVGDPSVGSAMIVACLTGPFLLWVSYRMIIHKRQALRWYYVLWPINFLSAFYVGVKQVIGKYPAQPIVFLSAVLFALFLPTIVFYAIGSVRSKLFESDTKMNSTSQP